MTHLRQLLLPFLLFITAGTWGLCADGNQASVRVVSQTVGSDELLLALAEPSQVAALSHLARNPTFSGVASEAASYPCLPANGDAETALRHNPTLVLCADYSRPELVSQLRRSGVKVLIFERYRTLEDTFDNLRMLARELGAESRAEALITSCKTRLETLSRKLKGRKPVRVLAPSLYGVIAGAETTFQDLCDHAAADNLAASLGGLRGHAAPPSESLLTWPIERLVVSGDSVESALEPYKNVPPYQYLSALREKRAVVLPSYLLGCVSHLRLDGYEMLAKALHPDLF